MGCSVYERRNCTDPLQVACQFDDAEAKGADPTSIEHQYYGIMTNKLGNWTVHRNPIKIVRV